MKITVEADLQIPSGVVVNEVTLHKQILHDMTMRCFCVDAENVTYKVTVSLADVKVKLWLFPPHGPAV